VDLISEAARRPQHPRRPSPLTLKALRHALGQTQRWLDRHDLAAGELGLLQCEEYFDELLERQAVSTVRRHLAYVRAAYRYAVRHDLVERDPTADVRLPRLPDHDPAIYSNEQLRAIHAAIRTEREELVFFLFCFAGLRLGEVAALEWRQVEFERWQLRLAGKGGKLRLVPLHPVLTELLREQRARSGRERILGTINGQALSANTLGRSVRAIVDPVDVDSPSHAFRRTVATVMYESGVRARVIERIMGWAPRQMYERHYLRVADQQMHEAIRDLYHDDPICERQQRTLQPRALPATSAEPAGWLATETTRLERLEQQLRSQTG
jgi:integrase/recombinase XerD